MTTHPDVVKRPVSDVITSHATHVVLPDVITSQATPSLREVAS